MLGEPWRSRSWGTPHAGAPSLPWRQAGAQRRGQSRGSSLTPGVSLSFGKAWWQGSPAGAGLRATWVMELSPQGRCVPFPPPLLPALQLPLAFQGGFLHSTPGPNITSLGALGSILWPVWGRGSVGLCTTGSALHSECREPLGEAAGLARASRARRFPAIRHRCTRSFQS